MSIKAPVYGRMLAFHLCRDTPCVLDTLANTAQGVGTVLARATLFLIPIFSGAAAGVKRTDGRSHRSGTDTEFADTVVSGHVANVCPFQEGGMT